MLFIFGTVNNNMDLMHVKYTLALCRNVAFMSIISLIFVVLYWRWVRGILFMVGTLINHHGGLMHILWYFTHNINKWWLIHIWYTVTMFHTKVPCFRNLAEKVRFSDLVVVSQMWRVPLYWIFVHIWNRRKYKGMLDNLMFLWIFVMKLYF